MSATVAQVAELRLMVNESTEDTYTDDTLETYIEKYPLIDSAGNEPNDDDWTATYNLYAAAADIVEHKAMAAAEKFDFTADGGTFQMSQTERALRRSSENYRAQAADQMSRLPC